MTWTSCQPPRLSGIVIVAFSVPSAPALALPSGSVTNAQQVLVQFTRLPTTEAHSRSTGAFGVRPVADSPTFESTVPEVESSEAFAEVAAARLADASVVVALIVGCTFTGQSTCVFGGPLSFVTVKAKSLWICQGTGDCSMFRYATVWLEGRTSTTCFPTGPAARIWKTATPRVQ